MKRAPAGRAGSELPLVRTTLQNGGLGKIELLWNGATPGVTAPSVAPIAQANPDGRNFDPTIANIVAAFGASSSGV